MNALTAIDESIEPAPKLPRIVAFLLDILLISVFTFTLLFVFVIPQKYAAPMRDFQKMVTQYVQKEHVSPDELLNGMPEEISDMMNFIQIFVIVCFWTYFTLTEYFTGGSSLGKKVFFLRIVNTSPLEPPTFFDTVLRSGLKTLSLFVPILMINYLFIFMTRNSQAGHDLLCRTFVIQDNQNLFKPS